MTRLTRWVAVFDRPRSRRCRLSPHPNPSAGRAGLLRGPKRIRADFRGSIRADPGFKKAIRAGIRAIRGGYMDARPPNPATSPN